MPKLIMLIGLPGSGKSTYAKRYIDNHLEDTVWCSSDNVRKVLYGDENIQGNPKTVFEHLQNDVEMYLRDGYNVIYDATNVTRKNRRGVINKFKNLAEIECHIVWAPYNECVARDKERVRSVGEDVIRKFLYRWQSPNYDEGFKFIDVIYNCNNGWDRIHYSNCMLDNLKIPHDNPHHTLDVYEHSAAVQNYIMNKWPGSSVLEEAGSYHDLGKPMTKGYKSDEDGKLIPVAHYYQHHCVGGYLVYGMYADNCASRQKAILCSWLVSNHMEPYFDSKYYKSLEGMYKVWIDQLHEADEAAH